MRRRTGVIDLGRDDFRDAAQIITHALYATGCYQPRSRHSEIDGRSAPSVLSFP
jgi:hypothetical protein